MAEMTQEELVQEVLDRVLQSSTGVEDLETVTSLSGVKSLPGEKDGKMVNVPLELIGKPASDAWMETGNVLPDKGTKPGGSVVYVADAGKFAYYMDSTLYGDWDVAGVPPAGMFMDADRTAILPDKLYLLGDAVYTGTGGVLKLLAYRHAVMSEETYEALQDKDANTLYLIYEEE